MENKEISEEKIQLAGITNEQLSLVFENMKLFYDHMVNLCQENAIKEGLNVDQALKVIRPMFFFSDQLDDQIDSLLGLSKRKERYDRAIKRLEKKLNKE